MSRDRQRLDELEATLREIGVPDLEGWRRRVDALQDAYERVGREHRKRWWLAGKIDSIRARLSVWRRTRELEAGSHAEFLAQHPDYADALKRGDKVRAAAALGDIFASERADLWRSESFARFLLGGLRARGFSDDDIADVRTMLDNIRRERPN